MSPMGKYDPGGKVCKPRRKLSFPRNSPSIKYISKATVQDSKRAANEAWIGAEIMCWKKWEIWFPDRRNTAPELSLQRKVIVAEVGQEEETVHCRRRCHRPSPVMKPYLEQASKICNWTAQVFVSKREKCICLRLFWYFSSSSRVRMCLISITNLTSNNNATYLAVEQFDNFPFWYSRAVLICRNYRLCTFSFVETSFIIRGKLSW